MNTLGISSKTQLKDKRAPLLDEISKEIQKKLDLIDFRPDISKAINDLSLKISIGCEINANLKHLAKEPLIVNNVWTLYAYDPQKKKLHVDKDSRALIPTGVSLTIPEGWIGMITPIEGYTEKYVDVVPTTIECVNPKDIFVLVQSLKTGVYILHGDPIAKLTLVPTGIQKVNFKRLHNE